MEIVAALVTGSLKNRERLEKEINARIDFYNKKEILKFKGGGGGEGRLSRLKAPRTIKVNQSDTVGNFMKVYLTKSSLELYKDANCRLVNLMRNYLLYFAEDFEADLSSSYMPDAKLLKKGISEVLNSWSNVIVAVTSSGNMSGKDDVNQEEFKFFTEIRENKFDEFMEEDETVAGGGAGDAAKADKDSNHSDLMVSVNDKNLVTTRLVGVSREFFYFWNFLFLCLN